MKSTHRFAVAATCALWAVSANGAQPQTPIYPGTAQGLGAPMPTPPAATVVAPAPVAAPPAPSPLVSTPAVLRLGTSVRLRTEEALSSKTTKTGDRFHLTVSEDVKVGDMTVIPAGAVAIGEVTNVTKKGAFGKSGKLDTRVLYVVIGDRNIPLTGTAHEAGAGGTGATVAVAIAAGIFSAFVTGHSAEYPVGTSMTAFTENDLPVVASMAVPAVPLVVPAIAPAPAATVKPAVLTPVSATTVVSPPMGIAPPKP